jgi:hypothetical protein
MKDIDISFLSPSTKINTRQIISILKVYMEKLLDKEYPSFSDASYDLSEKLFTEERIGLFPLNRFKELDFTMDTQSERTAIQKLISNKCEELDTCYQSALAKKDASIAGLIDSEWSPWNMEAGSNVQSVAPIRDANYYFLATLFQVPVYICVVTYTFGDYLHPDFYTKTYIHDILEEFLTRSEMTPYALSQQIQNKSLGRSTIYKIFHEGLIPTKSQFSILAKHLDIPLPIIDDCLGCLVDIDSYIYGYKSRMWLMGIQPEYEKDYKELVEENKKLKADLEDANNALEAYDTIESNNDSQFKTFLDFLSALGYKTSNDAQFLDRKDDDLSQTSLFDDYNDLILTAPGGKEFRLDVTDSNELMRPVIKAVEEYIEFIMAKRLS